MRTLTACLLAALLTSACGGGESEPPATVAATPQPGAAASTPTVPVATPAAPAATTSAPAPSPVTTAAAPTPTDAGRGDFVAFEAPPSGRNWLQVSTKRTAVLEEEPELCLILNDGNTGKINSFNFALEWSDEEWTLKWLSADGVYDGPVVGMVDGITVTFEGETGGISVRGSVVCVEA